MTRDDDGRGDRNDDDEKLPVVFALVLRRYGVMIATSADGGRERVAGD